MNHGSKIKMKIKLIGISGTQANFCLYLYKSLVALGSVFGQNCSYTPQLHNYDTTVVTRL